MARGDTFVLTAADLPFGFTDLDGYLGLVPRPRLVMGSKTHRESQIETPMLRRAMSAGFGLLRATAHRARHRHPGIGAHRAGACTGTAAAAACRRLPDRCRDQPLGGAPRGHPRGGARGLHRVGPVDRLAAARLGGDGRGTSLPAPPPRGRAATTSPGPARCRRRDRHPGACWRRASGSRLPSSGPRSRSWSLPCCAAATSLRGRWSSDSRRSAPRWPARRTRLRSATGRSRSTRRSPSWTSAPARR